MNFIRERVQAVFIHKYIPTVDFYEKRKPHDCHQFDEEDLVGFSVKSQTKLR